MSEFPDVIPVNTPLMNGNEKKYLAECIDSGWVSSEGPFVARFEDAFSARVGRTYGISVTNGTSALELAVAALKLGPGDEVIMPTFTIISCAMAVTRAGGIPVLVDADAVSWNMDVAIIEEKITLRTKAIMAVHIYGLPVDMDPLLEIAARHDLLVIEDAAEAIGLDYKGRPCGSMGDISIFSFYANKHVSCGEGGMVCVNDPALAERCRSLRNLCFSSTRFVHDELGWNMRMTNLQAAVALAQLEQLDDFVRRKHHMGHLYCDCLKDIDGISVAPASMPYADNVYWVYGIVLDDGVPFDATHVMAELSARKIGSRPFFWPLHEQPILKRMGLFKGEHNPVSEKIARRGFYPPSGLALSDEQVKRICSALGEIINPA